MALKVTLLQKAFEDLDRLPPDVRSRILKRIRWLGENTTVIVHHRLSSLPIDLAGLCRMRVGDYRVLYWLDEGSSTITIYRVAHRSTVYGTI